MICVQKLKKFLIFLIGFGQLSISLPVFANLYLQHSLLYFTHSDDVSDLEYNRMGNLFFLGASLDSNGNYILGQSIHLWTKSHTQELGGEAYDFDLMEVGPRFFWFWDDEKTIYLSAAYHFYARGTRKLAAAETEKISGKAMIFTFGHQMRIGQNFFFGASLNYYSLALAEATDTANTTTELTETFTSIYPVIELGLRF